MILKSLIIFSLLHSSHVMAESAKSVLIPAANHTQVSADVYFPITTPCKGVVVVSHGAGGNQRGYAYLGKYLASRSFLAVIPTHRLSDRVALTKLRKEKGLRDGLVNLTADPQAYRERLTDIYAAKVWAQERCALGPTVLVGHSMGAATVMIEAGAKNSLALNGKDQFDVYVALSPQGEGPIFKVNSWGSILKPMLLVTGTKDDELSGKSWENRIQPYRQMLPGCKWLAVIDGTTHLNFAGLGFSNKTEKYTTEVIEAFLDGVNTGCSIPASFKSIQDLHISNK